MKIYKKLLTYLSVLLISLSLISSCITAPTPSHNIPDEILTLANVPEFSDKAYVAINSNVPYFTESELTVDSYEYYSELDSLGRCGIAIACIGIDIMPTEDRGSIGSIKPSGWQSVRYDIVDGKYLYNRCHLIAFMLAGENANNKNLITGTRYMNTEGMLPFEDMVHDYVVETENHVMYRVTPIFRDNELVARGCLMEAYSVEDNGEGISFCVYVYNAQPGITINYADGSSALNGQPLPSPGASSAPSDVSFILNTSSKKYHKPTCSQINRISENNRAEFFGDEQDLIEDGYTACGTCFKGEVSDISTPSPTSTPTVIPTATPTPIVIPTVTPAPTASPTPTVTPTPSLATPSLKPTVTPSQTLPPEANITYVLNTSSMKYHKPNCSQVNRISEENKADFYGSEQDLIDDGYTACGTCHKNQSADSSTTAPTTTPQAPSILPTPTDNNSITYVLNTSSLKYHLPSCAHVKRIKEENKEKYSGSLGELTGKGYTPCGTCIR